MLPITVPWTLGSSGFLMIHCRDVDETREAGKKDPNAQQRGFLVGNRGPPACFRRQLGFPERRFHVRNFIPGYAARHTDGLVAPQGIVAAVEGGWPRMAAVAPAVCRITRRAEPAAVTRIGFRKSNRFGMPSSSRFATTV